MPRIRATRPEDLRALRLIRNSLVHGGTAPSVREVAALLGYRSPRSAAQVIDRLIDAGFLRRSRRDRALQVVRLPDELRGGATTVEVPLVGGVPCGSPLLAIENVEAMVPVSAQFAPPPHRYFLLRAQGDSMSDAGIQDGDLVLVRQQVTANDGDHVVALIDDEATIKELRRSRDAVALLPRSKNKTHKPIILRRDFSVQGVVVAALPNVSI